VGLQRGFLAAMCGLVLAAAAHAEALPEPAALAAQLRQTAVVVEVRHAHDGLGEYAPVIAFRGFPANDVLDALLGAAWRQPGCEIEFVAADGYRSAIPAAQFERYRAWLVYQRADGGVFVTDNVFQARRDVPLGPWYLVWDNLGAPELIALGDHYWPYQVIEVLAVAPDAPAAP